MKELNWSLLEAIQYNNYLTVKRLIKEGAAVNCVTSRGWTPLHFAARYHCNTSIWRLLLKKGASIDKKNIDGKTPLCLAHEGENKKAIRILKEVGAALTKS